MMRLLLLVILLCPCRTGASRYPTRDELVDELRALNLSGIARIATQGSLQFMRYLVPANHACAVAGGCPDVIVLPATAEDASKIIALSQRLQVNLGVKGGGHSYTCQSSSKLHGGGIMLDMRLFDDLQIYPATGRIVVGAGRKFSDILPSLKTHDLAVIHGQCLHVGVAGFTLHGGVHFGALSELHGLGSSNIVGMKFVLANGSIATIDGSGQGGGRVCRLGDPVELLHLSPAQCDDLEFAMYGAGSSFALVLSLTLKAHRIDRVRSAISILSADLSNATRAREDLLSYMQAIPEASVSLTFFGLDAYFKAAVFEVLFVKERGRSAMGTMAGAGMAMLNALRGRRGWGRTLVHFVVEASWTEGAAEGMSLSRLRELQRPFINGSSSSTLMARPWYAAAQYSWAVPSYDLVWGKGHSYAGASLTVPRSLSAAALDAFLSSFLQHLEAPACSDCVAVLHRVGPGLRASLSSPASPATSFHSGLSSAALWLEMDCGLFRDGNPLASISWFLMRHVRGAMSHASMGTAPGPPPPSFKEARWAKCLAFVDDAQRALDRIILDGPDSYGSHLGASDDSSQEAFHYPNVPNLAASSGANGGWSDSYYGAHYPRLQRLKTALDPTDVFRHAQSIRPANASSAVDSTEGRPLQSLHACKISYTLAAYVDFLPWMAVAIVAFSRRIVARITQHARLGIARVLIALGVLLLPPEHNNNII